MFNRPTLCATIDLAALRFDAVLIAPLWPWADNRPLGESSNLVSMQKLGLDTATELVGCLARCGFGNDIANIGRYGVAFLARFL